MRKLVVALIVLMTISIQAQESINDAKKESHGNKHKEFMQDLTPEEAATLRTKKMTLQLDLTESQQREIKKINLEMAQERSTKREERKKKMEQAKVQRPSKEERLSMMNNRLNKQIETKKKMKGVLNEKQYGKWEKSREHKVRKMKSRGKRKGMKQRRAKRQ